jgi:hypothetical protein
MSLYATAQDVLDVWAGEEADPDRIERLLVRAETILRNRNPGLAGLVASGAIDLEMLKIVLSNVVIRLLNNPEGYRGEHAGEVGYYYGSSQGVPGQLGFTRADLVSLGLWAAAVPRSVQVVLPAHRIPGGGSCW